jgi:hypothetical protein
MAGPGPAIHDFTDRAKDVDGRHKGGHDEMRQPASIALNIRLVFNRTTVARSRELSSVRFLAKRHQHERGDACPLALKFP